MRNQQCRQLCMLVWLVTLSVTASDCPLCLNGNCNTDGVCRKGCNPGYAGIYCDQECPSQCKNNSCHVNRKSSTYPCTHGCTDGYCGAQCIRSCLDGLSTCNRLTCNNTSTTTCPEGTYGINCTRCNPNFDGCDVDYGTCIRCREGKYGDDCEKDCTGCLTEDEDGRYKCQSGCNFCEFCAPGTYGDRCQLKCSTSCGQSPDSGKQRCNRATGQCTAGCQSGYHGLTCNYTCSKHCVSENCNQTTGECTAGCQSGYHGETCNYTCSKHCASGTCFQQNGTCRCNSGYRFINGRCEKAMDLTSCYFTPEGHLRSGTHIQQKPQW